MALCAGAAGLWLGHRVEHRVPQLSAGTWLDAPRDIGSLSLTDDAGAPFTQARLRGAPTLVFFGFTHCPDVCPTTLYTLSQLLRAAPVAQLRVAFITVDPERDTPAALKRYLAAFGTGPQLIGLTGAAPAIAQAAEHFEVTYNRVALPGGDYTMDHSAVLFLLDAAGHMVAVFTPPFDTAALRQDLQRAAPYLKG
jgi:protein SCO1